MVAFDDVWQRHQDGQLADGLTIAMPSIEDLILTKKVAARPRDADDVRWLQRLLSLDS